MTPRTRLTVHLLLALAGAASIRPVSAQIGQSDLMGPQSFVLTEREAVLLDLPEIVAPGLVSNAAWSSSGRYLLAARSKMDVAAALANRPVMERSLVLWSAATRQRKDVWKSPTLGDEPRFDWLPGADAALVLVEQPPAVPPRPAPGQPPREVPASERWLLRIDAARATARPLSRVAEDARLYVSPARPIAALVSQTGPVLSVIGADGTIRDYSAAARGLLVNSVSFREENRLQLFAIELQAPAGVRPKHGWYSLDLSTGKLTGPAVPPESPPRPAAAPAPFRLVPGRAAVQQGKVTQRVQPLWIESATESEQRLALVSANSPGGKISPRNDAVLYVSEGAAWVRPLVRMDRMVFEQARAAAERAVVMSNLKQVGTGLLLYSQDNDETLPPAGTDIPTALDPYIKAPEIFAGFLYTFPGGKLADVPEPAKTELGHVAAQGGRFVVFVDGHVQYQPGEKKQP